MTPAATTARPTETCPLYVDLDGTLTPSDTLYESVMLFIRRNPLNLLRLVAQLMPALPNATAAALTGAQNEAGLAQALPLMLRNMLGGASQASSKLQALNFPLPARLLQNLDADADLETLLRLAAVWNIPMATDRATADFLLTSPLMHDTYECKVPDYSSYLKRPIPVE